MYYSKMAELIADRHTTNMMLSRHAIVSIVAIVAISFTTSLVNNKNRNIRNFNLFEAPIAGLFNSISHLFSFYCLLCF